MTFTETESYPSFEDFMSEDKLPPVFPSSQSSNVSETQVYSQHLISEVCDRDTYGPFGIGITDDDLPPNFINSSLAYSPKSIPPHSPSDESSPFNITSASSSVLDPLDIATGDADDMLDDPADVNDNNNQLNNEQSEEDIMNVEALPLLENHEFMQYLDDFEEICNTNTDFPKFTYKGILPSPSITPSPSTTPAPTPVITETPTLSYIKSELTSSDSNNNNTITPDESVVKKPATRGRKRKLFTNYEVKKKDQNKEAARRYREKKKHEDALLEAEEATLIEKREKLLKEYEFTKRTHKEFVLFFKETCLERRKQ